MKSRQFSTGDRTLSRRQQFAAADFARCVKCGHADIYCERYPDGQHPNGDAYGTDVFHCANPECKWATSFLWDESAKCYYYETREWKQNVAESVGESEGKGKGKS